jgi:hypothetical protein
VLHGSQCHKETNTVPASEVRARTGDFFNYHKIIHHKFQGDFIILSVDPEDLPDQWPGDASWRSVI